MGFYADRVFPVLLSLTSGHFDEDRRSLLAQARGRVLEIGVGTGASLGFYGHAVEEVVGIDPSRGVLEKARQRLDRLLEEDPGVVAHEVVLQEGDAQRLPWDDDSFDTIVAFLTLCTIPDPDAAAREMRRVLRPGGILLVMEHVRAREGGRLARWQDRLDPLWSRAAVGCHLNRDTESILARAGFETEELDRYRERGTWLFTAPRIRGALTR